MAVCLFVTKLLFPFELSAAGAKRGVRNIPMRTVPSRQSTYAQPAEGRPGPSDDDDDDDNDNDDDDDDDGDDDDDHESVLAKSQSAPHQYEPHMPMAEDLDFCFCPNTDGKRFCSNCNHCCPKPL